MTLTDDAITAHQAHFLTMLDEAFRRFGVPNGLPPRLRDAVIATPRHRFVHRFRVGDGPLQDADADADGTLPLIYSDAVMTHVDPAGGKLPSSNSQPSYVLFLLHMLGLERGQAVLEIGSGSGWLAAVMARMVASVTGIELIPELAAQSRADLAALDLDNLTIMTGDGARRHFAHAQYDRAMITAGVWDLPVVMLDQVMEGGRVLAPIELRGGDGCDVTVFRRRGGVLAAEQSVQGWFVPLLGEGQTRPDDLTKTLPGLDASERYALPLGLVQPTHGAPSALQFRSFLGRTECGFVSARPTGDWYPGRPVPPFGLRDADGSLAVWMTGSIIVQGGRAAATRLAAAYARWAELGLPGAGAFQLEICRAADAPAGAEWTWVDRRGETALIWQLKPTERSWRELREAVQPIR